MRLTHPQSSLETDSRSRRFWFDDQRRGCAYKAEGYVNALRNVNVIKRDLIGDARRPDRDCLFRMSRVRMINVSSCLWTVIDGTRPVRGPLPAPSKSNPIGISCAVDLRAGGYLDFRRALFSSRSGFRAVVSKPIARSLMFPATASTVVARP